jgi:hypothetical protein
MKLKTAYQRGSAAVQLATALKNEATDPKTYDMLQAIIVLLAAPAEIRRASEPRILAMLAESAQ